jgi:hypothetical protein
MSNQNAEQKAEKETIDFHYQKGNEFRVLHVDGVYGGLSPDGYINMSVYNQRRPIPQKVVHEIDDQELGDEREEERESKEGVVREVEANIVMDVNTAIALRNWIDEKLEEALDAGLIELDDQPVDQEVEANDHSN